MERDLFNLLKIYVIFRVAVSFLLLGRRGSGKFGSCSILLAGVHFFIHFPESFLDPAGGSVNRNYQVKN